MAVKTINISLDEKLIKAMDKVAKSEYATRSDFIRVSILKNLNGPSQDLDVLAKDYKKFVSQYGATLKNLAKR